MTTPPRIVLCHFEHIRTPPSSSRHRRCIVTTDDVLSFMAMSIKSRATHHIQLSSGYKVVRAHDLCHRRSRMRGDQVTSRGIAAVEATAHVDGPYSTPSPCKCSEHISAHRYTHPRARKQARAGSGSTKTTTMARRHQSSKTHSSAP